MSAGSRLHMGSVRMAELAVERGLQVHDVIIHAAGSGPGGSQIRQAIRARRHHSYLIVLTKRGRRGGVA